MKFQINIPLNNIEFESITSEVCCIEVWKKLYIIDNTKIIRQQIINKIFFHSV